MRSAVKALVIAASVLIALGSVGAAPAGGLARYAGKLVISPDPPPTAATELSTYLDANLSKDGTYPIVKGPPWSMHIVGVLAKDAKTVTLTISEQGDAKPLVSTELSPVRRIVIAHTEATVAAGFANHKTYDVRIKSGKKVLAKAVLEIRD